MKQVLALAAVMTFSVFPLVAQEGPQSLDKGAQTPSPLVVAKVSPSPLNAVSLGIAGVAEPTRVGTPDPGLLPVVALRPIVKPAIRSEHGPSQREIQIWRGLLIAQHSAAFFDAWTTRQSLQSGNGYERNILVKPFANSVAIYPVLQVAPLGFDLLSHRMMRSENRVLRKTWWLPQAASITASIWCGSRNLNVANLRR